MDPEEMQNVEIYFGQNIQCFFTEKFIMKILIHFRSIPSSFPMFLGGITSFQPGVALLYPLKSSKNI